MECKTCGSPLTIEQAYCPFCGTKNEAAAKHIEDMLHYDREFTKTQNTVLKHSKWYSRYLAAMLAIVLAALANVIVIVLEHDSYFLEYRINQIYHALQGDAVMERLYEWENTENIAQIALYYDKTSFAGLDEAYRFVPLVTAYKDMEELKAVLIQLTMEPFAREQNGYIGDDGYLIERAASKLQELYEIFSRRYYVYQEQAYEGKCLEYINEMENQAELWMKAVLHFTDEDISGLSQMQKYEIVSLIDRRFSEYGN